MPESVGPSLEELGIRSETEFEAKENREGVRVELIGDTDPASLTREEFEQKAWLFHATRGPQFSVRSDYDYQKDFVDDATLGGGLYATADKDLAEKYAEVRPNGTMWQLMPYQARMLNLTSAQEIVNLPVPQELAHEWFEFAQPKILQMALDQQLDSTDRDRYIAAMPKIAELRNKITANQPIDLRDDILLTPRSTQPFSVVDTFWRSFCADKGWDGVIFVEGGDDIRTRKDDRSYVFYNPNVIGTYDDWQQRTAQTES